MTGALCQEECGRAVFCRGLCQSCYNRKRWNGSLSMIRPWAGGTPEDIDEIAVERAMSGDPSPTLHRYDRREAVRRLRAQGLSYNQVARRLRTSQRQVSRDIRVLGLAQRRLVVAS